MRSSPYWESHLTALRTNDAQLPLKGRAMSPAILPELAIPFLVQPGSSQAAEETPCEQGSGEAISLQYEASGQAAEETPSEQARSPARPTLRFSRGAQSPHDVRVIRERYLHHLGQSRLASSGYVPDLVPIIRWDRPTPTPTPVGQYSDFKSPTDFQSPFLRSTSSDYDFSKTRRGSAPAVMSPHHEGEHEEPTDAGNRSCLKPGSIRSSVINVTAATLGAGALALPRALYYSGLFWGPLMMLALACLSVVSIKVIVQLVDVSSKHSYEEIAKLAFGPRFALLVEVNIILFCFGTAVAYMITVGQISHQVLQVLADGAWWGDVFGPTEVLIAVTASILLPLSLLDSINDLRFASLMGVSCILYLIVVVVYVFVWTRVSTTLEPAGSFDGWQPKGGFTGLFQMLSVAIFAFCCQPNVPAIYHELNRRSSRRMSRVAIGAMSLCLLVYLLMGVTGFLTFGEDTSGNVLANLQIFLCQKDMMVISGFACMAVAVTMAFPLNIFPIRYSLETALFYWRPSLNCRSVSVSIAVTTVACALICAIVLPEINLVFELVGATTGSFVCFIGPGVLFWRIVPGSVFSSHKLKALVLVVCGVTFLVLGTYSSVLDVVSQLQSTAPAASQPTCLSGQGDAPDN